MFKFFKSKRYGALMLVFALIVQFISPVSLKTAYAVTGTKKIQVLATSDLHGRFYPWEYASDAAITSGMTKVSTIVKQLKEQNPNTIVVDNGDTIQDNSSYLFLNDSIHPMMLGMNEIGYDTFTLGNHEFNYGIPALEKVVSGLTNTTVLCGNVYKPNGERLGKPYKIVEKDGVKIAIIGMVTPHITKWDGPNLTGYEVKNPVEETKKVIQEIKNNNLADIFIASMHMGIDSEYGNGDSAREMALANPELSLIIAGHAHSKIVGEKVNNAYITEPGKAGEQVSIAELTVEQVDGKYKVTTATSKLMDTKDVADDGALKAKFEPYHQKALVDARQVIGKLEGGQLAPTQEFKGITQAQLQDSAVVDLILNTQLYYAGKHVPQGAHHVSGAALFNSAANIVPGDIKKADTSKVYQYDNTLMTLKINGAQLKKYMEWSANYYNTFNSGDLTISFDENVRMYNYDMFAGVKYDVNISKDKGQRIENLTYMDGTAVKNTDEIYLTINNYRANTQLLNKDSGLYKGEGVQVIYDSSAEPVSAVRDLIREYIVNVKGGVIKPEVDNNWKVTGYTFDNSMREKAKQLVNEGKLSIPASADGRTPNVKSLTCNDVVQALGGKTVNLITFNDFHGAVDSKTSSKNPGIAKFAAAIKKYTSKANDKNSYVVLSAGDSYQGSAMSNLTYGDVISEMLKEIGVKASALGNHEFDWGTDKINKWAKDGEFDFLASNVYDKKTGKPVDFAKPYKVITENGIKIGLIGIATPETAFKTLPANVANLEFRDPVAATNEWAAYLKDTEKVDAVVVLSHLGTFQDKTTKKITGEGADLANKAKGIDAIITAHSHQSVSGYVNGIPVVQANTNGRVIGQISLSFVDGKVYTSVGLEDLSAKVKDLPEDANTKAIYDKYNKQLSPILDEVITVLEKDLDHDRNEGLSTLGQFNTKLMMDITGAQIGLTNGGGIRAPLAKGNLTVGDMYTVFPFDNTLVTMELTGADLKKNLEHGINPDNGVGWIQYYGIKVFYDETKPVGEKISSIRFLDGTKVEMDKYYTVVTNDFMATNGDGYNFSGAKKVVDTNIVMRDAMIKELKKVKAVSFQKQDLLVKGADTTVDPVTPGKDGNTGTIPQAGAVIGTSEIMTMGFLVATMGCALYFISRKKEEQAA
jgi:2',3'-cyclic-nucleotide 2'-phosphodiesterase/3'-nucleotidase/5'-nucleotidase